MVGTGLEPASVGESGVDSANSSEKLAHLPWSFTTRGSLPDGPESRTMFSTASSNCNAVPALVLWTLDPQMASKATAIFLQAAASISVFPIQPTERAFGQGGVIGAKSRAAARSDPLPFECRTMLLKVAFDVTAWSFIAWPSLFPC